MSQFPEILTFLGCATPAEWVQAALADQETLLLDHRNNELKAAASAIALINRYSSDADLADYMSKLAREELVHHEQVLRILRKRGIALRAVSASRYAAALREKVRKAEPHRLLDTLVVGAFIEARSCERFEAISPHLDEELQRFYQGLLQSEARHFENYLRFARRFADAAEVDAAVERFRAVENGLILGTDSQFRFHSGVPEATLRAKRGIYGAILAAEEPSQIQG